MTYESTEAAKKVKQAIDNLATRAHAIAFQEGELAHLHDQVEQAKAKLKRERDAYDTQLEAVLKIFPALGRGFRPEPMHQTVEIGDDGMVHVVEVEPDRGDAA